MQDAEQPFRITPTRLDRLRDINELIARSKRHWEWSAAYLEGALPLHMLSAEYLQRNACFEAVNERSETIAFASLENADERTVLDNLWVDPPWIGKGVGRRLCKALVEYAQEQGCAALWVLPDPPAEAFYLKAGFVDTGERKLSRVAGGPNFSVLRLSLPMRTL